jgi:hypothetical protein
MIWGCYWSTPITVPGGDEHQPAIMVGLNLMIVGIIYYTDLIYLYMYCSASMSIIIYSYIIYIYIHVCTYIYIYLYITNSMTITTWRLVLLMIFLALPAPLPQVLDLLSEAARQGARGF